MPNHSKIKRQVTDYIAITLGTVLVAAGLQFFLIPNKILGGGVSGIATVVFHFFGFPVGTTMFAINVVLFITAFFILGRSFGVRSIFAAVLLSIALDVFHFSFEGYAFTDDKLIASIFGSLSCGFGMALVFNRDASTGGTDILARIVNKFIGMDMGKSLMLFDFIIAASAGIFFGVFDLALYSLLTVLITTRMIDESIGSFNHKKSVMIISKAKDKILHRILTELDRGATVFQAKGGFEGQPRPVILSIVNRRQMVKIRDIVHEEDPEGFMIIGNVSEVVGEGFKPH